MTYKTPGRTAMSKTGAKGVKKTVEAVKKTNPAVRSASQGLSKDSSVSEVRSTRKTARRGAWS
jgi:hypothetical protein